MVEVFVIIIFSSALLTFFWLAWRSNRRLILVKEMSTTQIFYWESIEGTVVSPRFESLEDAKYWWVKLQFKRYKGPEMRQRVFDRRSNSDMRKSVDEKIDPFGETAIGRRRTDKEIKVNVER